MKTITLLAVLLFVAPAAYGQEPDLGTEAQREAGRVLYMEKCAQCHGPEGAGDGVAADVFTPAPRDFTTGIFKFRSTASGELPTDADLKRSIREGMPYTGMPPWPKLSDAQVQNLVYHIKTFNDDFSGSYGVPDPITIPKAPSFSEEAAQRGRAVFEANQCTDCHGNLGRGDGKSAPTLEDQWGYHIRPADLTKRWTYRNGQTREDIYRTFTTGLDGSPMPSYELPEDESWALVDYVWSLSRDEANYGTVIVASPAEGALDVGQGAALFETARPTYFPIVGQVIEPGRAFQPGVNGVEVKAIYNEDEIAFLLRWHDMRAETSGSNSPTMAAPRFGETAPTDTTGAQAAGEAAAANPASPYSDAVAIQIPSQPPAGTEVPYFLFGDEKHAVDLWFADLAKGEAEFFVGHGSENLEPGEETLDFFSNYDEGEWTVVFKRARAKEAGLTFEEEAFMPIAFSIWDGFNEERGNRRGLTAWYYVYMEPMNKPSAALPMAKWAFITLVLELGLVFAIRRRARKEEAVA